jgi:hypothetical protein
VEENMNVDHKTNLPQQSDWLPLGALATVAFTVLLLLGLIKLGALH